MNDRIIDWLYGVITRPVNTLNEIARHRPAGWAFLVYTGVVCLTALVSLYGGSISETLDEAMAGIGFRISAPLFLFGTILLAVIALFVSTLLLTVIARLFGGKGGYWNLFSAYAFAGFPGIINVPVTFLVSFLGIFGSILGGIVSFAVSIWVLVLQVIAVRESHGLSTGMSILAYIIYIFILVAIPAAIIIWIIMAFISKV